MLFGRSTGFVPHQLSNYASGYLNGLLKDWQTEQAKVEAMVYSIGAMLKQGEDNCFNERMLLDVMAKNILRSTEYITMYKKKFSEVMNDHASMERAGLSCLQYGYFAGVGFRKSSYIRPYIPAKNKKAQRVNLG